MIGQRVTSIAVNEGEDHMLRMPERPDTSLKDEERKARVQLGMGRDVEGGW